MSGNVRFASGGAMVDTSGRGGANKRAEAVKDPQNIGTTMLSDVVPAELQGERLRPADAAPYRVAEMDRRDQRMRDLQRAIEEGMVGQDKLLGQNVLTDDKLDYLDGKRRQVQDVAMQGVLSSAFDMQDPVQYRQALEAFPQLMAKKQAVLDACLDQTRFLYHCMTVPFNANPEELKRLIRIIGGAEMVMVHPLEKYKAVDGYLESALQPKGTSGNYGIFSFFAPASSAPFANTPRSSEEQRKEIARACLPRFPAYQRGKPGPESADKYGPIEGAVDLLVRACEAACDTDAYGTTQSLQPFLGSASPFTLGI